RALALQRIPVEGVERRDLRATVAIEVREAVADRLSVERDAARGGVPVQGGGLVRVAQGVQLEHDSRREARAQIRSQGEPRGRRLAARGERSAGNTQPVAQVEERDLLRFAETGNVVHRGGFEFRGRRRRGKSAQKVGLTATQGWISTRGTRWSRRSSPSQRGRCARKCSPESADSARSPRSRRNTASRCSCRGQTGSAPSSSSPSSCSGTTQWASISLR